MPMPTGPFKGRPIDWDVNDQLMDLRGVLCMDPTPFEISLTDLNEQMDIAMHGGYRFVRGGTFLTIPRSVPLVPDPSMVETVRVEYDRDRFIEYGPEDEGWRQRLGFVKFERRPMMHVRILDVTCPVTGKRTRAIYAHPEAIEVIREVHRVQPRLPTVFQSDPV